MLELCQPLQLLAAIPLPIRHALEPPPKVAQLAMLEPRGAVRLMRMADKMEWAVHLNCNPFPIVQGYERVDAIPGHLAAILFLHIDATRTDFSHNIGLQLRRLPFCFAESVTAGLP